MFSFVNTCSAGLKKKSMGARKRGGRISKKFYSQIEQFQHYLNKYNGNIFLTEG
jgi:hypothetical protein